MKWTFVMTLIPSLLAAAQPVLPGVNDAIRPYIEQQQVAGAVALVIQDGQVVHYDALGLADVDAKRPVAKDDLFWVASQTKPMTAVCLMMLVEEGKLSIDDPVEKHLPEFKDLWQIAEQTDSRMVLIKPAVRPTLRHLLTHTSGVGEVPTPRPGTPLAEMVASIARQPLNFEPGSEWRYGNAASAVLGRVIEVVSGMAYEQFLQQRLLDPLGMKDTTFWPSDEQAKRLAVSYTRDGETGQLKPTQSGLINGPIISRQRAVSPGGGLFSTAPDIARFCQMLLSGGELDGRRYLKPETLAQMTRPQTGELKAGFTEGMSFGLHFGVVKEPQGVTATLSPGTFGHGGAFGTAMWIDPHKKRILLLMIQRQGLVPNGDGCDLRGDFQRAVEQALAKNSPNNIK